MKKIILVGGMSRSGKSTFLEIAKKHGYETASTSQTLDLICARFLEPTLDLPLETICQALRNKDKDLSFYIRELNHKSIRDFKIHVAENVIVPTYGRFEGIVKPTLKQIKSDLCFMESIGGEEYDLTIDCLEDNGIIWDNVNIRLQDELTGVDKRKLLPFALDIWNDKKSIQTLEKLFLQFME